MRSSGQGATDVLVAAFDLVDEDAGRRADIDRVLLPGFARVLEAVLELGELLVRLCPALPHLRTSEVNAHPKLVTHALELLDLPTQLFLCRAHADKVGTRGLLARHGRARTTRCLTPRPSVLKCGAVNRKIVHVLRKYDPTEWGGTETHVAEVTRRLGARGFPCEVHAPAGPTAPDHALGPNVRLVRYRAFLPFVASRARRRALWQVAGNIASFDELARLWRDRDVGLVHLHTGGRVGGSVRTAMRQRGRAYLVSSHGPTFANADWLAADTGRRLARTIDLGRPIGALLGSRRVIDDAARVIAFNEEEREAIAKRVGRRAVRMDHGVDVTRLASGSAGRAQERWPSLGDAKVVALVGRVCEQKNQVMAVRAFARGAPEDHRLVLAGAATDLGYRAKVEAAAEACGVRARVHLLGNLDPSTEVPDLFARATLCIVPSTHEAFGLAVLEAWAAGRPVLFARHSGLEDIAKAHGHGPSTVATMDEAAWSEGLGRMLASEALRREATEAGLRLVRERYDWDVVVDRLAGIYEEVLRETAGARW